MSGSRILLIFSLLSVICPLQLLAKVEYNELDADAAEVQKAAQEALETLGADRGAVAVHKNVISIEARVLDIIGIPRGMGGAGVEISARVEEVERALDDLGARVTETEISMDLPSDILFDFDEHTIRADAAQALAKVAVVIRAYPGKTVRVEGHTDAVGSDQYNQQLSIKRAEAVVQWLGEKEQLGEIPFQVKGWGESKPRATNETDDGRQQNRRVEIIIEK